MGFPNPFAPKTDGGNKKEGESAGGNDASKASTSTKAAAAEAVQTLSSNVAAAQEAAALDPVRATSVFEFGPTAVSDGKYMRGVCIGDDPDAIQACTWSIEPVQQGKNKETGHLYRIEF